MNTFLAHTTAIADAAEQLVATARSLGYGYPFPMMVDVEKGPEGPTLTLNGLPAFTCLERYRSPTAKAAGIAAVSAHTRVAVEAAAHRLAMALDAIDAPMRGLTGWAAGDVLGLYFRLSFADPKGNWGRISFADVSAQSDHTVCGTLCLDTATLCPVMGREATDAKERLRTTCDRLGNLLDHVLDRTKHWPAEGLFTWRIRDEPAPSRGFGPSRDVFAPTEEAALEADLWWHFQAPLTAIGPRLPRRLVENLTLATQDS